MRMNVHAAGGNLVQEGFPDVGFVPVHQGDDGPALAPEPVAEPRCQLKAPRSSADDNEVMPIVHESPL
jgi:hypothetical protein